MHWRRSTLALALTAATALFGACAQNSQSGDADAGSVSASSPPSGSESGAPPVRKRVDIVSQLPDTVEGAMPGVVGISTKKVVELQRRGFPFGFPFGRRPGPEKREKQGMGSGVVVDKKGTIITNHHVVKNADEITVRFSDRRDDLEAKIVGTDKATDIAVLQLENPPNDLQPLPFGNSDDLRLGEPVVAIGNPFGLSGTVTYGIVSAKGRANVGLADYEDFIQTDAAINPGNSGGALVNMEGELIGINTAILSRSGGYQGIGFAIPSNMAQSVMNKLLEDGEVERGYLGVMIQELNSELAESFEVPDDTRGVLIARVEEGSPADKAGLKSGDVVVEFEGEEATGPNDLRNKVARQSPGDEIELEIIREGKRKTVTVKLGALHGGEGGRAQIDETGILEGLVLDSLDQQTRQKFDVPDQIDHGIVVVDVERGSPAARTGLRRGDVILEVNRRELDSIDQFTQAYKQADEGLLLLIFRRGNPMFLRIPKVE